MSYADYRSRVIAAQDQWNRERDQIATEQAGVDFPGEFEPPAIAAPDNYDSMTLAQMVDAVNGMRPDTVRQAAEAWQRIATAVTTHATDFNHQFQRTIAGDGVHQGWSGQAARAASEAVNNYTVQSQLFADAATIVYRTLAQLHTGLNQTRALMPQATQSVDPRDKKLPEGGVMKAGDFTEQEATEEGRRVLRTVYGQVVTQADHGVPVLPTPKPLAADRPSPQGPTVPPVLGEDGVHG
ncbi:hypothetical protein [Nocardia callitridis]|uniref:PPE domain-containing protein n=1 Tax=Nocardia callitridis TaxID=648753 RepID=A0ABP9JV24_9NOCA